MRNFLNKHSLHFPFLFVTSIVFIAGCVTDIINPNADRVVVTHTKAPSYCHYLGKVSSNNINGGTLPYTSQENLFKYGVYSLKKEAYSMGGNYVELTTEQAVSDNRHGYDLVSSEKLVGQAYSCPGVIIKNPF